MKIEIKNRWTDKVLLCGKYESIKECLEKNKGADLRGAYLQGAYLRGAYLQGAYLQGAEYKEPLFYSDLFYLLALQPNITMRAWKYLKDGKSPYQHKEYEVGKVYEFKDIDKNKLELCGKGGNIATLNWCLKDNLQADEFLEVEFNTADLIVPYFTDGKFRVKKFKVLREINRKEALDLITQKAGAK
jgi:uncharacterized protein YjbI with pentapeptide repeats